MKDLLMARGARTLLDTCVAAKPGGTVLIVTDMVKFAIARVIAAAALERGAETIVTVMQPRARAGQEPPKPVAEAMKKADIVFLPVSYSVTHTHAVKAAAAAGARIIAPTEFTEEMMIHGGLEADFNELLGELDGCSRLTATARRAILTRGCRFRGTIRSIIVAGWSSLLSPLFQQGRLKCFVHVWGCAVSDAAPFCCRSSSR